MFGYVKAYKPELKMIEYDTYKAIYCSICKQLKKDYGFVAPFVLSYDFVFLAALTLAREDEFCGYEKKRCKYNCAKKCMYLQGNQASLSFSAACLIVMFYYKMKDDFADNGIKGKLRSGVLYPFFAHYRKKALKTYADIDKKIASLMKQQQLVENDKSTSIDFAAEPTAKMLEFLFSYGVDTEQKDLLSHVGYNAGKWVYLIDALDDLESDLDKNCYNPFIKKYNLQKGADLTEIKDNAVALLNNCNVVLAESFEKLELKRYKTILANIIYMGLGEEVKRVIKNNKEKLDEQSI